jgi:hypothetical protein
MPVITVGAGSATWGLSAQTGMLAQRGTSEASVEKNTGKNASGEVALLSLYNPTRSIEISGVLFGLPAYVGQTMGVTAIFLLGSPSGNVYCESVRVEHGNEDFAKVTVRGTQYNLL